MFTNEEYQDAVDRIATLTADLEAARAASLTAYQTAQVAVEEAEQERDAARADRDEVARMGIEMLTQTVQERDAARADCARLMEALAEVDSCWQTVLSDPVLGVQGVQLFGRVADLRRESEQRLAAAPARSDAERAEMCARCGHSAQMHRPCCMEPLTANPREGAFCPCEQFADAAARPDGGSERE